jgi:hypothetical protein
VYVCVGRDPFVCHGEVFSFMTTREKRLRGEGKKGIFRRERKSLRNIVEGKARGMFEKITFF